VVGKHDGQRRLPHTRQPFGAERGGGAGAQPVDEPIHQVHTAEEVVGAAGHTGEETALLLEDQVNLVAGDEGVGADVAFDVGAAASVGVAVANLADVATVDGSLRIAGDVGLRVGQGSLPGAFCLWRQVVNAK
jgi:hypothetical protein